MYGRLPDFDDFQSFDLSKGMELPAISERIPAGLPKTSRITIKHHLFNMRIRKKLFKSTHGNVMKDNGVEFTIARLFRRLVTIHISPTFNDLSGMDFVDYGGEATFRHLQDNLPRYSSITFIGAKKKKGRSSGKVVNSALTNWVSFFWDTGYYFSH